MADQCIFCKIASGEIPATLVYDSADIMAFLDIRPATPGHVLVIPKQHYAILPQVPAEVNAKILELVKIIAQSQVEALGAQGVNVLQNNGAVAGQAVPHVHFHVIPRFKDDKVVFHWEGLQVNEAQLKEIQTRLTDSSKTIMAGKTPSVKAEEPKQPAPKEEEVEPEKLKKLPKLKPRHG